MGFDEILCMSSDDIRNEFGFQMVSRNQFKVILYDVSWRNFIIRCTSQCYYHMLERIVKKMLIRKKVYIQIFWVMIYFDKHTKIYDQDGRFFCTGIYILSGVSTSCTILTLPENVPYFLTIYRWLMGLLQSWTKPSIHLLFLFIYVAPFN